MKHFTKKLSIAICTALALGVWTSGHVSAGSYDVQFHQLKTKLSRGAGNCATFDVAIEASDSNTRNQIRYRKSQVVRVIEREISNYSAAQLRQGSYTSRARRQVVKALNQSISRGRVNDIAVTAFYVTHC